MSYTIKHIRLNENNPFKKVSKTTSTNIISRATTIVKESIIKKLQDEFSEYYKNNIIYDFRTGYEKYTQIIGCDSYNAQKNINNTISFFESYYSDKLLADIKIKLENNGNITMFIPCSISYRYGQGTTYIFDPETSSTSLYVCLNKFFEYLFTNPEYGYMQIIKNVFKDVNRLNIKMDIVNNDKRDNGVNFVFCNMNSSTELVNTYINYFLDVFANPNKILGVNDKLLANKVAFVNCFVNSSDLSESEELLTKYIVPLSYVNYVFISNKLSDTNGFTNYVPYTSYTLCNGQHVKFYKCVHPAFNDINSYAQMIDRIISSGKIASLHSNVILYGNNINTVNYKIGQNGHITAKCELEKCGFTNELFRPIITNVIKNFNSLLNNSFGTGNLGYFKTTDQMIDSYDKECMMSLLRCRDSNKDFYRNLYDKCIETADYNITSYILKKKYNGFIRRISVFKRGGPNPIDNIDFGYNNLSLEYFIGEDNIKELKMI